PGSVGGTDNPMAGIEGFGGTSDQQAMVNLAVGTGRENALGFAQGWIDGINSSADEAHAARDAFFAEGLTERKALAVLGTDTGREIAQSYIDSYAAILGSAQSTQEITDETRKLGVATAIALMTAFPETLQNAELFDRVVAVIRGWAVDANRPATE